MPTLSRTCAALALLAASTPALADVAGGCRCDSGSLVGMALTVPLLAVALLARRIR